MPIKKSGAMLRAWKNVISKKDTRPILKYVHFDASGFAVGTDSHVLLRIDDYNPTKEAFNLNPVTLEFKGEDATGTYPDTTRLIPTSSDVEMVAPMQLCLENLITPLKAITKGWLVHIENSTDNPKLFTFTSRPAQYSKDGEQMGSTSFTCVIPDVTGSDRHVDTTLNAKYLLDCLSFFKDWLQNVPGGQVTIMYNGTLRPLLFESGKAQYLITPVRTF